MKLNVIGLAAALWLCGCSLSPVIDADIVDYNQAVSDSGNRLLLVNILRARDHAPLLFSSVQLVHGSLQLGAQTNVTVPFGNPPFKSNNTTLASLSAQVSPTFDVSSLDTQDFTRGILQPVDPLVVKYFLDRGEIDPKIILLLFFSELEDVHGDVIQITPDEAFTIQQVLQDLSNGKVPGSRFFANAYTELTPLGGTYTQIALKDVATIDPTKYRLLPDPSVHGKDPAFRLYAVSQTQKVAFCLRVEIPGTAGGGPTQTKFVALGNIFRADTAASSSSDPRCLKDQIIVGQAASDNPSSRGYEKVTTRSVEGMIQFLGAVLRWEARNGKSMTFGDFVHSTVADAPPPTIFGSNMDDTLFRISTNVTTPMYSVNYGGQTYAVDGAAATEGKPKDHTLEVLALVSKLLDMNKSAKDLPITQSVQIVP